MLRNTFSYSSIAQTESNDQCSCCNCCTCRFSCTSCCKCCIFRLPFGTILASLFTVCGLVISSTSLIQSTNIVDRLFFQLFTHKYLWLNDLKVVYIICAAFLGTIVLVNLIVGFATTGKDEKERSSRSSCCFCCFKSTITGCVVKTVFAVNYILFYAIFALTVLLTVALFICYIMSRLCNDGRYVTVNRVDSTYMGRADYADDLQQIDLRQLSPLLKLRANETDLLLFKEHRLKSLCVDYMSGLLTYVLLSALGFFLMLIGFVNYLINIGVNWARKNAKQKYAELFYINGAEMTTFGGDTDPQDDLAAHRY